MKKQDLQKKASKKLKNIKDFKPTDLGGGEIQIEEKNKLFGNHIYFAAQDISVFETAKSIYNELDFEVTEELISTLKNVKQIVPWLLFQFENWLKE